MTILISYVHVDDGVQPIQPPMNYIQFFFWPLSDWLEVPGWCGIMLVGLSDYWMNNVGEKLS